MMNSTSILLVRHPDVESTTASFGLPKITGRGLCVSAGEFGFATCKSLPALNTSAVGAFELPKLGKSGSVKVTQDGYVEAECVRPEEGSLVSCSGERVVRDYIQGTYEAMNTELSRLAQWLHK